LKRERIYQPSAGTNPAIFRSYKSSAGKNETEKKGNETEQKRKSIVATGVLGGSARPSLKR
jgi:hypothetical protein